MTTAGGADTYLAGLDPAGAHLWSKAFGDAASQGVKGLTTDSLGNVLFTGLLYGPTDSGRGPIIGSGGEDTFITRLGP